MATTKPIRSVSKTITPQPGNLILLDDGVSMGKAALSDAIGAGIEVAVDDLVDAAMPDATTTATGATAARKLSDRAADIPNVLDWNGVDFETKLNAAISSVDAGRLRINPSTSYYDLESEIVIPRSILLDCSGWGLVSTTGNGGLQTTTFRRVGTEASPIFRFQSATAGQTITGGGLIGALLNGNNVATIGVHARSTQYQTFDVATWSFIQDGVRFDGGNGTLCGFNNIRQRFTYGVGATPASANGIHLRGEDGAGCTRNVVYVTGLYDDGNLIFLDGNTDNNQFMLVNASPQAGSTGYGLYMKKGASAHPRSNRFYNFSGRIYEEIGCYGNEFISITSEQTSYEAEDGYGNAVFYSLTDYATGASYVGPQLEMRQEIGIPASAMMPQTNFGSIASVWAAILLDDSTTEQVYAVVPRDMKRPSGKITGVRISFLMASTNTSASVRIQLRIETATPGTSVSVADTNESFTVPVNDTPGILNETTLTLSSPLSLSRGDSILFRMDRIGADGDDTAVGDFGVVSAVLLFEYNGPVFVAGGGTFDVPKIP